MTDRELTEDEWELLWFEMSCQAAKEAAQDNQDQENEADILLL